MPKLRDWTASLVSRGTERAAPLIAKSKEWWALLASKGRVYWISVVILIVVGIAISALLEEKNKYLEANYWWYQLLGRTFPGDPTVNDITLVLIGDEEYWKGELGHRVPIKRAYLAELVRAIADGNPAAIALDFDFRSPTPDGRPWVEHPDYKDETKRFLETIKEVAVICPVVLPTTVARDERGSLIAESNVYNGFDWGTAEKSIFLGYILHDEDMRLLPVRRALKAGPAEDSFVQAIIRAAKPNALPTLERFEGHRSPPYGHYLPRQKFPWIPATQVLVGDKPFLKDKLAHKIVIVGGAWSQIVFGNRSKVDEWLTPVGLLPGVYIHANHVQAILCDRVYPRFPSVLVRLGEGALSLSVVAIFALAKTWPKQFLLASGVGLVLMGVNYVVLVNFGQYFDVLPPLATLAGHGIYEHFRDRRAPPAEHK